MVCQETSSEALVRAYFGKKIDNKSALRCYGDVDNADYSGFDSDLYKYLNEKSITEMVKVNTEIKDIMNKFKISIKINMGILNNLLGNHLPQTTKIALGITEYLPEELKNTVNKKSLAKATGLHDIAKVIMPEAIINKPGALNNKEREIMKEHARLSYEMLKTTDLDRETLDLIKSHHSSSQSICNSDNVENIDLQILSIADIYSALRERRSYKPEMSREKALSILEEETNGGKFHRCVYEALVEYSKHEGDLSKRNGKWKIFNFKSKHSLSSEVIKSN